MFNIKLKCLPPNCTGLLQPIDQGVIQSFKMQYRKLMLRMFLTHIDSENIVENIAKTFAIYNAIKWAKTAWNNVEKDAIKKCFSKCGFVFDVYGETLNTRDADIKEFEQLCVSAGVSDCWKKYTRFWNSWLLCESIVENHILSGNISNMHRRIIKKTHPPPFFPSSPLIFNHEPVFHQILPMPTKFL